MNKYFFMSDHANLYDLIYFFLDNGVMTTPKSRILSFVFTVHVLRNSFFFFCFIPLSLGAKLWFNFSKLLYLHCKYSYAHLIFMLLASLHEVFGGSVSCFKNSRNAISTVKNRWLTCPRQRLLWEEPSGTKLDCMWYMRARNGKRAQVVKRILKYFWLDHGMCRKRYALLLILAKTVEIISQNLEHFFNWNG